MAVLLLALTLTAQDDAPKFRYVIAASARPGETLFTWRQDGKPVYAARDPFAFRELHKASEANDAEGFLALIKSGRVFTVENETPVRVLEVRGVPVMPVAAYEFRAIEGQAKGQTGWVENIWLARREAETARPKARAKTKRRR